MGTVPRTVIGTVCGAVPAPRVASLVQVRAELDKRAMAALSSGHLATDFANGALPALLPFLKDRFSLSYTLAAVLMLASTAASSLVQPLFGLWSDRRGAIWLINWCSAEAWKTDPASGQPALSF